MSKESPKKNTSILLFLKKEPLFSKKTENFSPLDDNNPITVQVLGICSALTITVQLEPAVVMTMFNFVMACSNVIISLFRNLIPNQLNFVFLVVISSLVALVMKC